MDIKFELDRGNGPYSGRTYRLNEHTGVCEPVGNAPASPIWDLLDARVASIPLQQPSKEGAAAVLSQMLEDMRPELEAIIAQNPLLKELSLVLLVEEDDMAAA